jgi:hypothetical protein
VSCSRQEETVVDLYNGTIYIQRFENLRELRYSTQQEKEYLKKKKKKNQKYGYEKGRIYDVMEEREKVN